MELYYEGVNITGNASITRCIYADRCGERCDSLELVVEDPAVWLSWEPKKDDKIAVTSDNLNTGTLYLNTVTPHGGKYRIVATSVPSATRYTSYTCYENMSLAAIMGSCAAESGMSNSLYGIDGSTTYPYLLRPKQSGAAFMRWLLEMEGAVFKTYGEKFIGIGIEYAQNLDAAVTLRIREDQPGLAYRKQEGRKLAGLTVATPYARCTAEDSASGSDHYCTVTDVPATSVAEALRWAHGLLLTHNRQTEELCLELEMMPALTAMAKVNIDCESPLGGNWVVDEAKHDLKWKKTSVKLLRCIDTIQ